jgi:CRP-like cAMP-binding protein
MTWSAILEHARWYQPPSRSRRQRGDQFFLKIGVRASTGQLFGEFAIFSPEHARTASAVCATDAVLYIDEQAIVLGFHQHPSFAFALMRLIMRRTVDNVTRLETNLGRLQQQGRSGA